MQADSKAFVYDVIQHNIVKKWN